jgi:hypothetical protein
MKLAQLELTKLELKRQVMNFLKLVNIFCAKNHFLLLFTAFLNFLGDGHYF